jgi:hypothetical protein
MIQCKWIWYGLYIGLNIWTRPENSLCIHMIRIEVKLLRGLVKPMWIIYEESWIGLTILLLFHICFYENQTRVWLILAFISRWHSSKAHNIEEMILSMDAQYDVTQEWLDRVKIARKGLRGTKWRWRPSDDLWTKEPCLRLRREYLH